MEKLILVFILIFFSPRLMKRFLQTGLSCDMSWNDPIQWLEACHYFVKLMYGKDWVFVKVQVE